MIEAFHSAGLGLAAGSEQLAVIGRNMANVSTVGYRASEVDFADTLYRVSSQEGGGRVAVGTGVKMSEITEGTSAGALKETGRALDFAIAGDGYFCVQGEEGLYYTRAGNFTVSKDGWLTAPDGKFVLDADHGHIAVSDKDGKSVIEGLDQKIGVFTFASPMGLVPVGNNQSEESLASGAAKASEGAAVRQGCLEGSGVDLAGEMAKMLKASRSFQANARMVKAADEIEETANGLRA
jgi:flagellar basal body rod protein FlgG